MNLPGNVVVAPDTEDLFDRLGSALMAAAMDAVSERGVFHLALSGGGTPEPFYIRLVTDPKFRLIPWPRTHVWIVDERRVPPDHDKANIKMIRESLTDHVTTPAEQVHAVPTLNDEPAEEYEADLAGAFGMPTGSLSGDWPRLDFILLGMGGDCHTASLFPGSPALDVTDKWIVANDGENVTPPPRVTMTYPLINHGREVVVLATGDGKREALQRVAARHARGRPDIEHIPISGIDPADVGGGRLTWYLDAAAAGAS